MAFFIFIQQQCYVLVHCACSPSYFSIPLLVCRHISQAGGSSSSLRDHHNQFSACLRMSLSFFAVERHPAHRHQLTRSTTLVHPIAPSIFPSTLHSSSHPHHSPHNQATDKDQREAQRKKMILFSLINKIHTKKLQDQTPQHKVRKGAFGTLTEFFIVGWVGLDA